MPASTQLGGGVLQPEAACALDLERLIDGHRAIDELQLGREQRDVDAIRRQRPSARSVSSPATPPPAINTRAGFWEGGGADTGSVAAEPQRRVVHGGEACERQGGEHEPEVAQGDVVVAGVGEQVDDDPASQAATT